VAVVRAASRNLTGTLEIAGELLPYQEVDVYAEVSGYLGTLNITKLVTKPIGALGNQDGRKASE